MSEQDEEPSECAVRCAATQAFCLKHFLPLGFLTAIIFGLGAPVLGKGAGSPEVNGWRLVPTMLVCNIFIISGLTLKTEDIVKAVKEWKGIVIGLGLILVLTPSAAFAAINLPLEPEPFRYGLAVFCCVPTTLSSGVALVKSAGGNDALALILTVSTNLMGIFTVPYMLKLVLTAADVELDSMQLLTKLMLTLLVPLIVGKLLQLVPGVADWVKKWKKQLGLLNNGSLICIVWIKISQSSDKLYSTEPYQLAMVTAAGICLHLSYLAVNWLLLKLVSLPEAEYKAVWIMASQKTLPVSISIISFLDEDVVGEQGLLAIPCIVGHISQLFIDAAIVSKMASDLERRKQEEADAAESSVLTVETPRGAESENLDCGPTALDPKTDAEESETNEQEPGQGVQTELELLHSATETKTDDPPVGERSGPFYYRRHGTSNTE